MVQANTRPETAQSSIYHAAVWHTLEYAQPWYRPHWWLQAVGRSVDGGGRSCKPFQDNITFSIMIMIHTEKNTRTRRERERRCLALQVGGRTVIERERTSLRRDHRATRRIGGGWWCHKCVTFAVNVCVSVHVSVCTLTEWTIRMNNKTRAPSMGYFG